MNRQQAPQPVVRPLIQLTSVSEVAEYIKNYPADGNGRKEIVASYETENGSCIPIVLYLSEENEISVYGLVCDQQHFVDSSGVENEIEVRKLPCYSTEISLNLTQLYKDLADAGGWDTGEWAMESRENYNNYIMSVKLVLE